jgi:hypothetical protein
MVFEDYNKAMTGRSPIYRKIIRHGQTKASDHVLKSNTNKYLYRLAFPGLTVINSIDIR